MSDNVPFGGSPRQPCVVFHVSKDGAVMTRLAFADEAPEDPDALAMAVVDQLRDAHIRGWQSVWTNRFRVERYKPEVADLACAEAAKIAGNESQSFSQAQTIQRWPEMAEEFWETDWELTVAVLERIIKILWEE